MRFFTTALIFCGVVAVRAQTPVVPPKMHFAGMTLSIRDDARREIQKDVDALTMSPRYYNIKAERARTYFPIIEKIFAEERVPDDFKFLCLQESALIADAVSVSDAVGFWQFKDFTAREMGLRVDAVIDERMNIVSSTRAAARYIKQNNFQFNNWIYALQSYQMGAGGVKRVVGDFHDGARHMEITSETYWYVKKFLAHKIAFEPALETKPQLSVRAMDVSSGAALTELAEGADIELTKLQEFNKWVRADQIPADKTYALIVPTGEVDEQFMVMPVVATQQTATTQPAPSEPKTVNEVQVTVETTIINEIPAIQAKAGETLSALSRRAGVEVHLLMKYNDIPIDHHVRAGEYYYLDKKKAKSAQEYHTVRDGESLWSVSQQYGLQIKRLRKYNQLSTDEELPAGAVLWLSGNKPKSDLSFGTSEEAVELEPGETFDWVDITSATDPNDSFRHQVKAGETLYSIAQQHQTSVSILQETNGLTGGETLKVGQILKIAENESVAETVAPAKSSEIIHEVKPSETLYSVARQYGISIKQLMEWNEKTEFQVSVGEKLRIFNR